MLCQCWKIRSITDGVHEWIATLWLRNKAERAIQAHFLPLRCLMKVSLQRIWCMIHTSSLQTSGKEKTMCFIAASDISKMLIGKMRQQFLRRSWLASSGRTNRIWQTKVNTKFLTRNRIEYDKNILNFYYPSLHNLTVWHNQLCSLCLSASLNSRWAVDQFNSNFDPGLSP